MCSLLFHTEGTTLEMQNKIPKKLENNNIVIIVDSIGL
jgi:hypothetical protein